MVNHEKAVEQFYRRITAWCIIRQSVGALTLWAFLWGTAVLIVRTTQDISSLDLLWGLIGIPITLFVAVKMAVRQLPVRASVRALLDERSNCGGLLMAGAECNLGRWNKSVAAVQTPSISWNYRRPVTVFMTSIAYILLGFLLPIDRMALAGDSQLEIGRETDRLSEQVRILKQEKLLDNDRAESLKKKLEQLRSDSAAKNPAKTLEALDHLNDVMKQAGKQASESFARDANRLNKIEKAAEALQSLTDELDQKTNSSLMAELAAMAEKAAEESEKFKNEIDTDLAEALKSGKLSPEQMAKLASASQKGKEAIQNSAEKLFKGKLIDSDQLKLCTGDGKGEGNGKGDSKSLADFLKKNGGKTSLGDALDKLAMEGEGAGRGGVNEGPGAAPIQFGDRSSENGAKFREEALPPGQLSSLKESQTTGVSSTKPPRDPKTGASASGALMGATAGGGSANTGQILPQHKGPVERYFDRSGK